MSYLADTCIQLEDEWLLLRVFHKNVFLLSLQDIAIGTVCMRRILLWYVPNISDDGKFIWYFCFYCGFQMFLSVRDTIIIIIITSLYNISWQNKMKYGLHILRFIVNETHTYLCPHSNCPCPFVRSRKNNCVTKVEKWET